MARLHLTETDEAMLAGQHGPAVAMAMRIVTGMARATDAEALLHVSSAHIDGCLYHGTAGLDFAERLVALDARVRIPSTLNVSSLDLLHPELIRADTETQQAGRRLMAAYEQMGCRPTWTCAPYQLAERPSFGQHIAWAESNAIVFANSVLGARSDRYGDFIDIAAAITGRAPAAGLHLDDNRRARVVYDVSALDARLRATDVFFAVLGHLVGFDTGTVVPAILGLDAATEDQLKALGASAASSGTVGLIHVVGVTPEAPTLDAALGPLPPERTVTVTSDRIRAARDELTLCRTDGPLRTVNLGTPHYSARQLATLVEVLAGRSVHPDVTLYVNTSRDVLAASDTAATLADLGAQIVTDTCTYVTAILDGAGTAMTDSGKWAHYAPGNLGLDVVFASLEECVESAVAGQILRSESLWS
ncbi:MAG: aconitase X catalytic domain-containing protein [Acidimicrobiia bacterium]|nr:aconitase X catalytic domain-containing protein [Acidimicrobiia bacterium]